MRYLNLLLIFVPLAIVGSFLGWNELLLFWAAAIGVVPLAGLMGQATEALAELAGPRVGGLLNATLGNAAELIITIVAIREGLVELVKASITGSILGTPLVGNVTEHLVGVQTALKNQMELSLSISIGSSLQVALFVAPVLVFVSLLVGHPLTLVFNQFELIALFGASLIAALVALDGESNWLEGAQLLVVYAIIGMAFFYLPV